MTTATKKASKSRSPGTSMAKRKASSPKKKAAAPAKALTKLPAKATGMATKAFAGRALRVAAEASRHLVESVREHSTGALAERVRRIPIQCSIDVAVPVHVAWEQWEMFEFLPEGSHRVEDIERDGDGVLIGRLSGAKFADDWEAEILDERPEESFAWRSVRGSDCAGLVTFHSLSERLTRIELQLDIVPSRLGEAAALATHLADRRARTDLKLFKARLETINPDEYPPPEDEAEEEEEEEE